MDLEGVPTHLDGPLVVDPILRSPTPPIGPDHDVAERALSAPSLAPRDEVNPPSRSRKSCSLGGDRWPDTAASPRRVENAASPARPVRWKRETGAVHTRWSLDGVGNVLLVWLQRLEDVPQDGIQTLSTTYSN